MRCGIVLNGDVRDDEGFLTLIDCCDVLICADGGARHLHRLGIPPDSLIGDLDSVPSDALSWLKAQNVPMYTFPSEKDATDAELAIEYAIQFASTDSASTHCGEHPIGIWLLAALGGRPDHVLANQLIAAKLAERYSDVLLSDGCTMIYALHGPCDRSIPRPESGEALLSAIAVSDVVQNLTYEGLQYPLQNATLKAGTARGVSNRFLPEVHFCRVTFEQGTLLLIITPIQ